jgi:hypothetical protein
MTPALDPVTYVFASVGSEVPQGTDPVMTFREDEGTTLIVTEDVAVAYGLASVFPCRRITLTIHSSLEAVGFMAAITTALARSGIGVNPVSGYFHDHLFVPKDRVTEAMEILHELAGSGET